MPCPTCHQHFRAPTPDGRCPLCGAPVAGVQREVTTLYIVTGAIFASVLVYAGIVAFLETTGEAPAAEAAPILRHLFFAVALAVCLQVVLVRRWLSAKLGRDTLQSVMSEALISAALCEFVAILGLVLYFLGGGVNGFVLMLVVSVLGFLHLGSQMPWYVRRLEEYAVRDAEHNGSRG